MKLYNTLTRKKEEFKPLQEGRVHMYVCGPTVYDYCHLGHARAYVAFDVIRRYLEYMGYKVTYVENFTDVDDKIMNRARETGEEPLALSSKFIDEYFKDMDALGVKRSDIYPKVSEHIPDIIEVVKGLIKKDYAYEIDGDVYFRVSKFKNYAKLSRLNMDEVKAGARVKVDERKESPLDFALWKKAKKGELSWDSPWGKGRPGWHIECSVMSAKYLGPTFDIHGGGQDLIFPHHTNEIAQAEAYTGKPFVKYWLHNGFITVNKEKMSKSLGNFFTVRDILKKYEPDVVRFFLLSTHYRSPIDFSDEHLENAKKSLERLNNALDNIKYALKAGGDGKLTAEDKKIQGEIEARKKEFLLAMDDDFNTTEALGHLFEIVRVANRYIEEGKPNGKVLRETLDLFEDLGKIFNMFQDVEKEVPKETIKALQKLLKELNKESDEDNLETLMKMVVDLRQEARDKKDWKTSDKIRDDLNKLNIVIEDEKEGARWKIK